MTKKYKRDKRSPSPKNENVSKLMSSIKAKDTKPELILRKGLTGSNLKGYRLNSRNLPGTPDIAYFSKKVAIFVHGCYWHRCPHCNLHLPKHNVDFWKKKFAMNVERDNRKKLQLEEYGWTVIIIWACEIENNLRQKLKEVKKAINREI